MTRLLTVLLLASLYAGCATHATPGRPPDTGGRTSIAAKTAGLQRLDGFIRMFHDAATGKLYLEVARPGEEFLYLTSLATGIGSNALGLDRGTIGDEALVRFERHGPRMLLVQRNTAFRAASDNADLVRSVEESFATSVIGSFPVVAEDGARVLVDATEFFLRDAFDVRGVVRRANQGDLRLERDRSAIWLPRTKAFPKNTEVEVLLTFASEAPGREIARHAPDPHAVTLRQHHSLVQLPEPGYEPRAFDPRVGLFPVTFMDFARSFEEGYERRWITRWRLKKKDPAAEISEPVTPIVYYLDAGIPEPYRSAFRDGAMWWNRVLEAAGFRNAFLLADLPSDVDPMDARYSVIQWVHRTEPGFSIGPSFRDPRTGEIIKAAVRMDSHRSITDFNLYAGMAPATGAEWAECALADAGPGDWIASLDPNTTPEAFAMARRRQHAAHEVGHTLGLSHNFIASSYGRASVMDYPGPLITLAPDGFLDLSNAYRGGPGAYDTFAIRYAYIEFASAEAEAWGLADLVDHAVRGGLRFMADQDAAESGAIPAVTRWLNGSDATIELERTMRVRDHLLARFGPGAVWPGEPLFMLNQRLAPVYLHHRYALEGAIKTVGGMDYTYALRGDGQVATRIIDPARQRAAIDRLPAAIQPGALAVPEYVAGLLAPRPYGYAPQAWQLQSPAGAAFDQLAAARSLASFIVDGLLHRERVARLAAFSARNSAMPGPDEVMSRLVESTWGAAPDGDPGHAALLRVAERAVLDGLITLATDERATVEARAAAEWRLERLAETLRRARVTEPAEAAHTALALRDIARVLERRDGPTPRSRPLPPPPGTPIGEPQP